MSDAVVVGSGPNGLAAAIRIAEAGGSVLVLEAADEPGGAVRTEELTLPGSRHDTFSAVYPAAAASPVFARMPLRDHGLEWVHPAACAAYPLPDGGAVVLYRDLDATAASLNGQCGGDGDRWQAFAGPFLDAFGAVRATMLAGFPPVKGPLRLLADAGPVRAPAPDIGRHPRAAAVSLRGGARMAVRCRHARRRTGLERGQRDRRLLSQPARSRRRLAQSPWRRWSLDRRSRGLSP